MLPVSQSSSSVYSSPSISVLESFFQTVTIGIFSFFSLSLNINPLEGFPHPVALPCHALLWDYVFPPKGIEIHFSYMFTFKILYFKIHFNL